MLLVSARVLPAHTEAFRTYTRRRFEPTHGEGRGERGGFSSLFLVLSSSTIPSFSSFVLSLSLSLLFLSSLSNDDNDHSSSRFSLCTHGPDLAECQSTWAVAHSLLAEHVAEHVRIMQKQLSWYNCASLVPLGMKWACICAGNGYCVWWCLVVFGGVSVLLCVSMCCLSCVVGCVSIGVDALAVVWW